MKKAIYKLIYFAAFLHTSASYSQNFAVSLIPDSLLTNANAVYRFSSVQYERQSVPLLTQTVHYAVTILNKDGDKHATLVVFYDNLISVTAIEGTLYNAQGIKTTDVKPKDIRDEPAYPSYTLFSDNRVKFAEPKSITYPYTIEYSYKLTYKGFVGIYPWMPIHDCSVSLQEAELTYSTPSDIGIKQKIVNGTFDFLESRQKNIITYRWSTQNQKAILPEPYSPPYTEFFPAVLLSPTNFEYDKTQGDFSTWESYGKWSYSLIKSQGKLSEKTILDIENITKLLTSKREKVKRIYEYMQSKTRYVSISLGIGGFKPFSAIEVDKTGYGDCKALSNYTKCLLEAAGIDAYYTEIGNGTYQKIAHPDFASAYQSNHVILCVPLNNDTIWLECTNQKIPFGYIGSDNANRYALVITPQGGKLVKTPAYSANNNLKVTLAKQTILPNGNVTTDVNFYYKDMAYEEVFELLLSSKQEQKEFILKNIPINNLTIDTWSVNDHSQQENISSGSLHLSALAPKYASVVGQRIFIPFNPFNRASNPFGTSENRISDIYLENGLMQIDTLYYTLPDGYNTEYLPEDINTQSVIGNYSVKATHQNGQICLIRNFILNKGQYSADKFPDILTFFKQITDYDSKKIILKKQP